MLLFLTLLFWQAAEAHWFKDYGWALIVIVVTNAVQYYFTRPKTESDIQKNSAEIVKSLLSGMKDVQDNNKNIFEGLAAARQNAFRLEKELEKTRGELDDCLKKDGDCERCRQTLIHAAASLKKAQTFIADFAEAKPLFDEVSEMIGNLNSIASGDRK